MKRCGERTESFGESIKKLAVCGDDCFGCLHCGLRLDGVSKRGEGDSAAFVNGDGELVTFFKMGHFEEGGVEDDAF